MFFAKTGKLCSEHNTKRPTPRKSRTRMTTIFTPLNLRGLKIIIILLLLLGRILGAMELRVAGVGLKLVFRILVIFKLMSYLSI